MLSAICTDRLPHTSHITLDACQASPTIDFATLKDELSDCTGHSLGNAQMYQDCSPSKDHRPMMPLHAAALAGTKDTTFEFTQPLIGHDDVCVCWDAAGDDNPTKVCSDSFDIGVEPCARRNLNGCSKQWITDINNTPGDITINSSGDHEIYFNGFRISVCGLSGVLCLNDSSLGGYDSNNY